MCVPRPRKGQTEYFSKLQSNCMKKFCALFFLAAMIFAGCSEKDDAIAESPNRPGETPGQPSETPGETPALTIGTTKYTFPAEGGSVQIPFEVNVDWKTSIEYRTEDSGWLTLTPESGEAGNVVLTITAESNSATEQRTATVHILYSGRLCEVFVIQSARTPEPPVLTPNVTAIHYFLAKGDYRQLSFEVNVDWETSIEYAAGDSGWLTLTPESGEAGNVVLTITAEANSTTEQRKAFVRILYGEKYNTLTIIQSAIIPTLKIEYTDYAVAAKGGSVEVPFKVNVDWKTSIEYAAGDSGWLTLTPESGKAGKVALTITGSGLNSLQRKATVRIFYGEQSCELSVVQSENDDDVDITAAFDPFFARTLQSRGYIADANHITYKEVRNITQMNVSGRGLTSLQGIEYFSALTSLNCRNNELTSLDVSGCTALTSLICYFNQLISLDISGCTALEYLDCSSTQLNSLDVSNNLALTNLDISYNRLTLLDVSRNIALTKLNCRNNELTLLDVSRNTALATLNCYLNRLTSLDVSKNTALTSLDCQYNQLIALDVSNNLALTNLDISYNRLTLLDVSRNTALRRLGCHSNRLTSLDISKNTLLEYLLCSYNKLNVLDVSNHLALIHLNCEYNQLTSLDVSRNTALTKLYCHYNQLTSLDVSRNTALMWLGCHSNKLTSLDISKNTLLESLQCDSNPGKGYVFYVTAWFDNNTIPTGPSPSDPDYDYRFTSGSWTYNGHTIDIEYRKIR